MAAVPFHNPALFAKQVSAIQEISHGRLALGVGAGWNRDEFAAFGLPFERRVDRFEDSIGVIRRLLAGETVTHESEFVSLQDCVLRPESRFGLPPIFVGSNRARMLAFTLPWVTGWNSWFASFDNDLDQLALLLSRIDGACGRVARDPETLDKSVALLVQFGPVSATVREPRPWRGSAGQLAERLSEVAGLGIDHVQLILDPVTIESIEAAAQVLDEFRAQPR